MAISSGVITTYSSTLVRNLGYDPKQAALMNMPSGAVSIFFTLLVGYGVCKYSNRWMWIIICIIPDITGAALMSFLPISNKSGVLVGIYLVNAVTPLLVVFYNWTAANCGGATKRAFAAALFGGAFSVGNIIGPQTFQARDAPEYRPAEIAVLASQAACGFTTLLLFLYYYWQNKKRGAVKQNSEEAYLSPEMWSNMTDRENEASRYSY